jgi:DNA polymerase-3 subunit gamma/tau
MTDHLRHIATKENINISSQAITLVAQIANGGLRDAESLLDQLSLLPGVVTPERIWDLVGVVAEPDLLALLTSIRSDNPETVITQGRNLMNKGREPLVILQNLANFYLNLLLAKTASNRPDLGAVTAPTWEALSQEAKNWDVTEILQGQKHLKDSELQIKNTTVPRLWLEITLLGLLPSALSKPQIAIETTTSTPAKQSSVNQVNSPIAEATTPATIPETTKKNIPTKPIESPVSNSVQEPGDRNPITGNNDSLEVWERVLEKITKHSAKVLFKQQANLISFRNNVAHIGLKNQSLVTIATKDISFIEEAFYSVFQQKITVKLQVTSVANSQNTVSQPPIQTTEPISPRVAEPPAFTPSPKTQDENRSVVNDKPPETKDSLVPPQGNIEEKPPDNLENNYSQVTRAAENIAKFFDGEIIVLDDPKAEVDKSSGIEEKTVNTNEPLLKGRPDITEIDGEDIPF